MQLGPWYLQTWDLWNLGPTWTLQSWTELGFSHLWRVFWDLQRPRAVAHSLYGSQNVHFAHTCVHQKKSYFQFWGKPPGLPQDSKEIKTWLLQNQKWHFFLPKMGILKPTEAASGCTRPLKPLWTSPEPSSSQVLKGVAQIHGFEHPQISVSMGWSGNGTLADNGVLLYLLLQGQREDQIPLGPL